MHQFDMRKHRMHSLYICAFLVLSFPASASEPVPGGHFRSGSLAWRTVSGNTIEFELQTAWRRSYEGFYVNGLPALGEIYAGDEVSVGGSLSPRFDFGDGGFTYINVNVTDFSVVDDWIFGVTTITHTYSTPNRGYREDIDRYGDLHITQGAPWTARFSGCCRLSTLQNQAGDSWNMSLSLDTQLSTGFPALRSMATLAFPRSGDQDIVPLCPLLPAASSSRTGTCTKLEFSTLPCANHESPMAQSGGFVVAAAADQASTFLMSEGGIIRMPCSGGCPAAGLHLVSGVVRDEAGLEAAFSVLAAVQPRHACTGGVCNPAVPDVQYLGHPLPSLYAGAWPWIGFGWDAAALRVVPPAAGFDAEEVLGGGVGGVQTSHGHAVAFAGREWSMKVEGEVNWCQLADGSVPSELRSDPSCLVPDTQVTLSWSRLPAGAELWSQQEDAIVELLLTYDNPFEAHRPGHESAVARGQRDLVDHPSAEQALQLGFQRLDANLNSGAGGASVYLWFRRFDPAGPDPARQRAITHLNVSASAAEEAALAGLGFQRLEGNLNEQAGGPAVFLWFKRASGSVRYSRQRPAEDGVEVGIAELAVRSPQEGAPAAPAGDANLFLNGTQRLAGWERAGADLNAGLANALQLWFRRGVANPWAQTVRWRPCACDVGRHFVCAAARSSLVDPATAQRGASQQRCLALDVLPDSLPQFRAPAPRARLQLYVGRELRSAVEVAVEDPLKQVNLSAHGLPRGAALDLPYQPAGGCEADGGCYWHARDLVWTPGWDQGGLEVEVCFRAEDAVTGCEPEGQGARAEVCAVVAVERCVYALQAAQHLQEVATLFGTDWLNLFSLNPSVTAPDRLLHQGQLLNFGHLYTVVAGDTADRIVKRFGTTVEMLLATNADLEEPEHLNVGQLLCIVPDSCAAGLGL